ncbi:hypothetical protein AEGHOMDF_6059 [Methylobacterium soli]|nr:hypothetical protein AEGHOMDF_6059 [Methylobacterium soli]
MAAAEEIDRHGLVLRPPHRHRPGHEAGGPHGLEQRIEPGALEDDVRGLKPGDLGLLALALLLGAGALAGWQAHQAATLEALDANILAARRAAGPPLPPALQAGAQALAAERASNPPVAAIWDAVAAALPDTMSAEALRLDGAGLTLTLTAPEAGAALRALAGAALPGLGAPILREEAGPASPGAQGGPGRTRLTLVLPRQGAPR